MKTRVRVPHGMPWGEPVGANEDGSSRVTDVDPDIERKARVARLRAAAEAHDEWQEERRRARRGQGRGR
jgi:hypothetical protein